MFKNHHKKQTGLLCGGGQALKMLGPISVKTNRVDGAKQINISCWNI
jgi:hypothetical protein